MIKPEDREKAFTVQTLHVLSDLSLAQDYLDQKRFCKVAEILAVRHHILNSNFREMLRDKKFRVLVDDLQAKIVKYMELRKDAMEKSLVKGQPYHG